MNNQLFVDTTTFKTINQTFIISGYDSTKQILNLPFRVRTYTEYTSTTDNKYNESMVDTIILNHTAIETDDSGNITKIYRFNTTSAKLKNIVINNGGFLIVNDSSISDPTTKFNDSTGVQNIKIDFNDGNLVYNANGGLYPSTKDKDGNNTVINCNLYINKNVSLFHEYKSYYTDKSNYIIINGNVYNEGTANIYTKMQFGFGEPDKAKNKTINNYGNFRLGDAFLNKTSIATNGLFIIRGDCKIRDARISIGLYGQLDIGNNVRPKQTKLTFEDTEYMSDWIVEKITNIGKINLKENAEIILTGTNNIKLLMSNNNINSVKFDGKITNKTNNEYVIKNNGIIYLENDFETEGDVKISNNDVVVSFNKDPVFGSNDVTDDRYLNVSKLYYSIHGQGSNLTTTGQIKDVLFELNSSDIESDVLNTTTYLLTKQFDETYTENKIDEILRLNKFGLLKDLPYNPPVRPPIYPPKPKYQPGCPCFK